MIIQPNSSDLLKTTAFHEAGHAAIFHLLGNDIGQVYIRENGSGSVESLRIRPHQVCLLINKYDPVEVLNRYGLECLSGPVAEMKFLKRRIHGPFIPVASNSKDGDVECFYSEMDNYATHLKIELNQHKTTWNVQQTIIQIFKSKRIWNAVKTLANELCSQKDYQLDGDDVHYILEKNIPWGRWQGTGFGLPMSAIETSFD